jgi:hypothetical protein
MSHADAPSVDAGKGLTVTIEDDIRCCDQEEDFGPRYIALARSVHETNDRRAAVKRRNNERHGSEIIEEKSYTQCASEIMSGRIGIAEPNSAGRGSGDHCCEHLVRPQKAEKTREIEACFDKFIKFKEI